MKKPNLLRCFVAALFVAAALLQVAHAQPTFPVNGTLEKDQTVYIIEGATLHPTAAESYVGNLVIKNGRIVALGASSNTYANAVRIDAKGYHIYPSFVDLWSDAGMPETPQAKRERGPQDLSSKKGAYGWNEAIRPETKASDVFSISNKAEQLEKLRKAGFGTVLTHLHDGIVRGTGAVVALSDNDNRALLRPQAAAFSSFRKGSSTQDYPSSLMGAIALLRQTYLDAAWYAQNPPIGETNLSLAAFLRNANLPQFFECSDKLDILRADRVGDEFKTQFIFKDGGDTYQRLEQVKATGGALIVSLNYPETPDVSDPYLARLISLAELKHWELAAGNAVAAHRAGIEFAFTANGLSDPSKIIEHVRKAIQAGLPEEVALRALTETPAKLGRFNDLTGSLKPNLLANFILTDGLLFDEDTRILENWVLGKKTVIIDRNTPDLAGYYTFGINAQALPLEVTGKPGKHSAALQVIRTISIADPSDSAKQIASADTTKIKVKISQEGDMVNLQFGPVDSLFKGVYLLTGNTENNYATWKGAGQTDGGQWFTWQAVRDSLVSTQEQPKKKEKTPDVLGQLIYPFTAYGRQVMPEKETLLITNATVWTSEAAGKIENGQVLIHDGKIRAVGTTIDLGAVFGKKIPAVTTYDAQGKHVTAGIIDEHSHIAISRGVNEGTQASSAEVSIGTVVNSEDVNIYRQLSGGVTAAQLLHGSANPVGGQSALIKLRWGASPEEMQIDGADFFIKFALGENVKQANWGEYFTSRFPQSRMGVEQVYYDLFIRAREYESEWAAYNSAKKGKSAAPRRDLELETLLQILNSERFISCHSYRQDEINMLMHVADSLGFRVNTFTHILEGYKVADKMKAHGAGGSSFSDWWAYKYEVKDAIPQNGAILWSQGVVTAFNSDDAEMARRLNQEAAKAFKYGGVPEEEALKFVTLNPAILLHLDDRMGSLAPGKDADLVIWSDHPLSVYAKAEATFVDGRRLFDREEDARLRAEMQAERARILQKMLNTEGSAKGPKPSERMPRHYHCETITDEIR